MKIVTPTATAVSRYASDHETRFNEKGQVHHSESAKRNALAMLDDVAEVVPFDKVYRSFKSVSDTFGVLGTLFSLFFFILPLTFGLVWDIGDILLAPFRLVKDGSSSTAFAANNSGTRPGHAVKRRPPVQISVQ